MLGGYRGGLRPDCFGLPLGQVGRAVGVLSNLGVMIPYYLIPAVIDIAACQIDIDYRRGGQLGGWAPCVLRWAGGAVAGVFHCSSIDARPFAPLNAIQGEGGEGGPGAGLCPGGLCLLRWQRQLGLPGGFRRRSGRAPGVLPCSRCPGQLSALRSASIGGPVSRGQLGSTGEGGKGFSYFRFHIA